MTEVPSFPDASTLAAPIFIGAILLEMTLILFGRVKGVYETRDTAASLIMGVGSVFFGAALGGAGYYLLLVLYDYRVMTIGFSAGALVLCFIIDDMRYYWAHRLMHRSRWFWAAHVVHHSSQHFNLSTALRQSWTGPISGLVLLRMPLVLIGFHPAAIAFVYSFNLVYQFFIHTEAVGKLPRPIEWLFNTPSHHRVHHGRNARYLDANYAGTLIIWDRLFGTFVPETEREEVRYGIVRSLGTFNPLRIGFHEYVGIGKDVFARGRSMRDRLLYLFAPPGWSHDGSRLSSEALKEDYVRAHPEEAGQPGLPALSTPPAEKSAELPLRA